MECEYRQHLKDPEGGIAVPELLRKNGVAKRCSSNGAASTGASVSDAKRLWPSGALRTSDYWRMARICQLPTLRKRSGTLLTPEKLLHSRIVANHGGTTHVSAVAA